MNRFTLVVRLFGFFFLWGCASWLIIEEGMIIEGLLCLILHYIMEIDIRLYQWDRLKDE